MSTLLDLFGYLTVLAHAVQMIAQTVLVGSVIYGELVLPRNLTRTRVGDGVHRVVVIAAIVTVASGAAALLLNGFVLRDSLQLAWREIAGATFVRADVIECACAVALGLLARADGATTTRVLRLSFGAVVIGSSLATSHAAARVSDEAVMLLATGMHELGAALWLGALPALWLTLERAQPHLARRVGRRFSAFAMAGVGLILAGAALFAIRYMGSLDAFYGTAYGLMALAKAVLLALLLVLGFYNFRTLRGPGDDALACARVRRVVEAEAMLGLAVIMAAASITSLPPAIDMTDRVGWSDVRNLFHVRWSGFVSPDRDTLALPMLQQHLDQQWAADASSTRAQAYVPGTGAAPPRNAADVAWSEYNHHWAGVLVFAIGVLALLYKTGRFPAARHWPLVFLALAVFLFVRSDPEAWPLGDIGFVASLRDPEVMQHRAFVALVAAFSVFEWRVRTERVRAVHLARVFPAITAVGALLLLGHSHALGNAKDEVLIEISHLAIAVLGIVAATARWLELDGVERDMRWPVGWIWPACFVGVGVVLIAYGEP